MNQFIYHFEKNSNLVPISNFRKFYFSYYLNSSHVTIRFNFYFKYFISFMLIVIQFILVNFINQTLIFF
jgi:hypothetical protein